MTSLEVAFNAHVSLYGFLFEILLSTLFVNQDNPSEVFERFRLDVMDRVQYKGRVVGGDPHEAGVLIQAEMVKVAEVLLERVSARVKATAVE